MEPVMTPGDGEADEAQIERAFAAEGLEPHGWSNGPHDTYGTHSHSYHKVLYCLRGSITFIVGGRRFEMHAGDRLDLPEDTPHSAVVGPEGVACMEAARHP